MACHLFLSLVKKVLGEHVLPLCHWHLGCLGRAYWLATSIRLDRLLWNLGALLSNSRSTEAQNGRKSQTRRQKETQGSVWSVLKLSHIFNHYMFMLNKISTNLVLSRYPLPPHQFYQFQKVGYSPLELPSFYQCWPPWAVIWFCWWTSVLIL